MRKIVKGVLIGLTLMFIIGSYNFVITKNEFIEQSNQIVKQSISTEYTVPKYSDQVHVLKNPSHKYMIISYSSLGGILLLGAGLLMTRKAENK